MLEKFVNQGAIVSFIALFIILFCPFAALRTLAFLWCLVHLSATLVYKSQQPKQ